MARTDNILITCEHGGNHIPPRYRCLFRGHEDLLHTHRGYDAGALTMAKELAEAFDAPLFVSTTSRLLIDLNRSIGHPRLYSVATSAAPGEIRREILKSYYLPYRAQAESHIAEAIGKGWRIIHISSHSFTPVLDGQVRNADIGLLYDPRRVRELALCSHWQAALKRIAPQLKVRRNYPYTGKSDGFTAYLRRRFPAGNYLGIELEINQAHPLAGGRSWRQVRTCLREALHQALADAVPPR
jgi:predicted N-formylglutamate amidohydrolase